MVFKVLKMMHTEFQPKYCALRVFSMTCIAEHVENLLERYSDNFISMS